MDFIDNQRKSKTMIAADLKMSRRNLYQLFESKSLEKETKTKFEEYFGQKIFKVKPFQERLREQKLQKGKKQVPFFDAPGEGGNTVHYTEMTPISAPTGTIDVGDLLSDSEAAIRVYGNSMIPNYPPGCVIGLARCGKNFIEPGEVYVVETRDRRLVKRLFYKDDDPATGEIMCYSDNIIEFKGGAREGKLAYPPFYVPLTEIINLFYVTGVIKRNANSVIINR